MVTEKPERRAYFIGLIFHRGQESLIIRISAKLLIEILAG